MHPAHPVALPGAGNCDIVGLELHRFAVHGEAEGAAFEKRDLNAFIAVPVERPALIVQGVPVADGLDAGKAMAGEPASGVMTMHQRFQADLAAVHRLGERPAAVRVIGLVTVFVDWNGRLHRLPCLFELFHRTNVEDKGRSLRICCQG